MKVISKELLSEVFSQTYKVEVEAFDIDFLGNFEIMFSDEGVTHINIHALAHKVKEWASKQKEIIYIDVAEGVKAEIVEVNIATKNASYLRSYNAKLLTPENIFDYGQWILENRS